MKNKKRDRLIELQREYARKRPWRLNADGLFVPHSYEHTEPDGMSYWDDVGFVLAKRRHIIWWQHPRYVYETELSNRVWAAIGPSPREGRFLDGAVPSYKKAGRARKRIVSYELPQPTPEMQDYFAARRELEAKLAAEGIDFEVRPSFKMERLSWAMGASMVAPFEVRSEAELKVLADAAKRLARREVHIDELFEGYRYTREDWLRERPLLSVRSHKVA